MNIFHICKYTLFNLYKFNNVFLYMNKLVSNLSYFTDQYSFVDELDEGDKLYKCDDKIMVHKNSYFQGLSRYFSNETRENSVIYISKLHEEYVNFLYELIYELENGDNETLTMIILRTQNLNDKIIHALKCLDLTYEQNYEPLKKIINIIDNVFRVFTFKTTMIKAKKREITNK